MQTNISDFGCFDFLPGQESKCYANSYYEKDAGLVTVSLPVSLSQMSLRDGSYKERRTT